MEGGDCHLCGSIETSRHIKWKKVTTYVAFVLTDLEIDTRPESPIWPCISNLYPVICGHCSWQRQHTPHMRNNIEGNKMEHIAPAILNRRPAGLPVCRLARTSFVRTGSPTPAFCVVWGFALSTRKLFFTKGQSKMEKELNFQRSKKWRKQS